jgi:acetylornithine aminotransferase/acetylornithine/N-succinyldiaminopimelate aminotransferase
MTLSTVDLERRYQLPAYARLPLSLQRGEGVHVFDEDGRRYLDLYGGHAVASTGHSHPAVVEAIAHQAKLLLFYSNVVTSPVRAQAAGRLIEAAGPPFHQVFFVNSGAEANEAALRVARQLTGRQRVVALEGAFHGRTLGAASVTTPKKKGPPPHDVTFIAANDVGAMEDAIDGETAAVIVEPIQSMAGVRELSGEFLVRLRETTSKHGAFLIFDEVQTGAGRTGHYLYSGVHDVHADLVALAKGIASGVPMGALLAIEQISQQIQQGDLGSTFGGGPLACAALNATLDVLERENILARVRDTSAWLHGQLAAVDGVEEVRGRGLLLGLKLEQKAADVQKRLLEHHIIVGTSAEPNVMRLLPPLILTQEDAAPFLEALPRCL